MRNNFQFLQLEAQAQHTQGEGIAHARLAFRSFRAVISSLCVISNSPTKKPEHICVTYNAFPHSRL